MGHRTKQENMASSQEKNQSVKLGPKVMDQDVKLLNNNVKIAIMSMFHMFKKVEEDMSMLNKWKILKDTNEKSRDKNSISIAAISAENNNSLFEIDK